MKSHTVTTHDISSIFQSEFRPQDGVRQPALGIQQGLVLLEDDDDLRFVQAVHGPYDPAVFYGKKDLPLREVPFLMKWHKNLNG